MKSSLKKLLIVVFLFFIALFIGIYVFSNALRESISYCDEKYGKCNWEWEETTGTEECKGIGQCWKCVPKHNKCKTGVLIECKYGLSCRKKTIKDLDCNEILDYYYNGNSCLEFEYPIFIWVFYNPCRLYKYPIFSDKNLEKELFYRCRGVTGNSSHN